MPAFILTRRSIILCPHGGMVMHTPTTVVTYRVAGDIPMLQTDLYHVVACPNPNYRCGRVMWATASKKLILNGVPALLNTSVGLCQTSSGMPLGPAMIMSYQTTEPEPGGDFVTE